MYKRHAPEHLTGCQLTLHLDESASSLCWSSAEVGTALLCASLSSLRPLASRIFPNFFSHFTRNAGTYPIASVASEANVNKLESHHTLPIMRQEGIHVEQTYEVTELSILPEGRSEMMKGTSSIYAVPFGERSSKEQLVKTINRNAI